MKTGYDKAKLEDNDTDSEDSYQSVSAIAQDIVDGMAKMGYRLVPDTNGKHAGHNVYIKAGLEVNPDIEYWKLLSKEIEWIGFQKALEVVVERLAFNGSEYTKIARKIEHSLTIQGNDNKSLMAGIGYSKAQYQSAKADRSYTGKLAYRQIPRLSWFGDLEELSPFELLALFPEAEAKLLMLMLGRALCGVGGTISHEGAIAHKMRAAAIIVGIEAGLGKSTILNGIIGAMERLGYTSEAVVDGSARFGWGEVATSDLAYRDDLNKDTQTAILKSEKLKTIITGGRLSTERKGIDSTTTIAKTTFICCSNDYNVYDFYKMDGGSISRFNFLYTYNQNELKTLFPDFDARTNENFTRLASKYDTSVCRLYTYLLAHSVEYFLTTLGYVVVDDQLIQEGEDKLQDVMTELRSQCHYSPSITHVKDLVTSTAHLLAVTMGKFRKPEKRAIAWSYISKMDFDYALLYEAVRHYSLSETSEAWDLKGIASGCKRAIRKRLEEVSNKQGNRNANDAFSFLTAELLSADGATFPKSPGNYVRLWVEARKSIPMWAQEYADTLDYDELSTALDKTLPCLVELAGIPTK